DQSAGRCPRARRWRSRAGACGRPGRFPRVIVRELELDLDAFEGPLDLLLTLVLKEELDLAEVDVAAIVVAFCERLAERGELDLEACGEFLVLVAALLELKARSLFPDEEAELAELEPEEAAEELAMRLAEYRRGKERGMDRPLRLITAGPVDRLARTLEALLVVASQPLSLGELVEAANDDPERIETALALLGERFAEGRSGIVLEHVAGG